MSTEIKREIQLEIAQQRAGDVAAARATYRDAAQDLQRRLDKVARDSVQEAGLHAYLVRPMPVWAKRRQLSPKDKQPWPGIPLPKIHLRARKRRTEWRVSTLSWGMPITRFPFLNGCCRYRMALRLLRHCCDSIQCSIHSEMIRASNNWSRRSCRRMRRTDLPRVRDAEINSMLFGFKPLSRAAARSGGAMGRCFHVGWR
jgi:hypothetical protein